MKTNFCQCNNSYHKDNPYNGVCNMMTKPSFVNCYFCYMGHSIPDTDIGAESGEDQFYQKGEEAIL